MTVVKFWTPGAIPLTSFTIMGAHHKVVSDPIGKFGTGLKYAVAVILRHGGKIRLFIEGVEYEFVVVPGEHRGQPMEMIRLRRKNGLLNRWVSVQKLPFTLSYGKGWELWQAYRELESNTRDERGVTFVGGGEHHPEGTLIEVDCPGFVEAIRDQEVFFDSSELNPIYSGPIANIYAKPSSHLYYRGIRVFQLRYPARFTYDFKYPYVSLTEDRTAANSWSLMYHLSQIVQNEIEDVGVLRRMFHVSQRAENAATFETMDLNFDVDKAASPALRSVAASLVGAGVGGRSLRTYWAAAEEPPEDRTSVELPNALWEDLLQLTKMVIDGAALNEFDTERLSVVVSAIEKSLE